jgi:DNA-directed RNA polymerase specialized sigma24 family protein
MGAEHLLQRIVFRQSERYEIRQETLRTKLTMEDMIVRYLKHLAKLVMRRNSFYAMVGIGRILHNYGTRQTMNMYGTIAPNRADTKDDDRCRDVKRTLMAELKERFGTRLKLTNSRGGEQRFEAIEDTSMHRRLVFEALERFMPWDIAHVRWDGCARATPGDLDYSDEDSDGEDSVEIRRFHAVIDPVCFRCLTRAWDLTPPERCISVPQFVLPDFSNGPPLANPPEDLGSGGCLDRYHAPDLSEEEIGSALEEVQAKQEYLQQMSPRSLSVFIDGIQQASFDLPTTYGIRLDVNVGQEIVEVLSGDEGKILVTHLMTYDEQAAEPQDRAAEYSVGRGDVTIVVPPRSFDSRKATLDILFGSGDYANRELTAVRSLTLLQFIRLRRFARWRMRGLGRKAAGRNDEDLLSEAITATIAGDRTWREGVDFYQHLLGAMRSISTSWHQKHEVDLYLESELQQTADDSREPLDRVVTTLDPERILTAKEELQHIRELFAKDAVASRIVELLAMGWTAEQICAQLQMSARAYGAAIKRIRRTLSHATHVR